MVQASSRRTPSTSSGTRGSAALSTPANIQLSGAWGFYESRHQEDNLAIRRLEQKVREQGDENKTLQRQFDESNAQLVSQKTQAEVSETERKQLQAQLASLKMEHSQLKDRTAAEINRLANEAAQLRSANQLLRDNAMVVQGRASQANSELAACSEELAALQRSERLLVERIEEAEGLAADLVGRNAALERENATLLQQRDHHINHSELLMKEKNRYFSMMMELRARHHNDGGDLQQQQQTPKAAHRGSTTPAAAPVGPQSPSLMGSVKAASGSFTPKVAVQEAMNLRSKGGPPGSAPPRAAVMQSGVTPTRKTPMSAKSATRRPATSPYGGVKAI